MVDVCLLVCLFLCVIVVRFGCSCVFPVFVSCVPDSCSFLVCACCDLHVTTLNFLFVWLLVGLLIIYSDEERLFGIN